MKTTFKIDFQDDVYELKGNNWGKEILYRNGKILSSKRNLFSTGNAHEFDCAQNGRLKLSFNINVEGGVINVKIIKEEELLAEYNESIEHLIPKWVKKVVQLDEESEEESEDEAPENSKKKVITGLISLAGAMLIWGFMYSWLGALLLIIVLFIHELGHYMAMTILGYKKRGIVFLPPFGAVAYGVKKNESEKESMMVLLSGPLPGLLIGFVLFFSNIPLFSEQLIKGLAIQFLILNYINLLPISPLDGGKIVETVFLHKFEKFQLLLAGLGLMLIGGFGVMRRSLTMIFLAVIFAILLYARVDEMKNRDQIKPKKEERKLSPFSRVVVGILYLTLLIIPLIFLMSIRGGLYA